MTPDRHEHPHTHVAVAADSDQRLRKKDLLWKWLVGMTILVVMGGLVASYIVIKNAADQQARAYEDAVTVYLDEVYDRATTPTDNPSDLVEDITSLSAPVVGDAVAGLLSDEYLDAQRLEVDVKQRVSRLTTSLQEYAQVYVFYTDHQRIATSISDSLNDLSSLGSRPQTAATFSDILTKYKSLKKVADTAELPLDLQEDLATIVKTDADLVTTWQDVVVAYSGTSGFAYALAADRYSLAYDAATLAFEPITTYYNDLSAKAREAAETLREYQDAIDIEG